MEFKPKIIVVEDDRAMLRLLGELLVEMGAEPVLLTSSIHAAELVERDKFDGAILDWRLPEMDGLELTRRIRSSKSNSHMPVVMISGAPNRPSMEEIFKTGVNFFLQKPVHVAQLRQLLRAGRGAMLQERRRYQRAPVLLRASVRWRDRQGNGEVVNLSGSGALLALSDAPPEDAELNLEFSLPAQTQRLQFTARVVRVSASPPPGHLSGQAVAVEFTGSQPQHRHLVIAYVEKVLGSMVSEP